MGPRQLLIASALALASSSSCSVASLVGGPITCESDAACPSTAPFCVDFVCARADDDVDAEGKGEGEGDVGEGEGEGDPVGGGDCADPFRLLPGTQNGDTRDADDDAQGSCSGSRLDEVWSFAADADVTLRLSLNSVPDGTLFVRTVCDDADSERACRNNEGDNAVENLRVDVARGETAFIFVDTEDDAGSYTLGSQVVPVVCGDGFKAPQLEACEDGNVDDDDACGADCDFNVDTAEIEPNDDGAVGPGGPDAQTRLNDIDQAAIDAAQTFSGDARIEGGIEPQGDEDLVAVTNAGVDPVTVVASTQTPTCDPAQAAANTDTVLTLMSSATVVQSNNDDINNPAGNICSRIGFDLEPGETRFVVVSGYNDDVTIPRYVLDIDFE